MMNDESMGAILLGGGVRAPVALPVIDNMQPISSKVFCESLFFSFMFDKIFLPKIGSPLWVASPSFGT